MAKGDKRRADARAARQTEALADAQRDETRRQARISRRKADQQRAKAERKGKRAGVRLTAQDFGISQRAMNKYPGLKKVTDRALREEWTPERYRAAVMDTDWYTSRTASQRKFDLAAQTDPEQTQANIDARYNDLKLLAQQMGVTVDEATLRKQARVAVRNDLDEDDINTFMGLRWKAPADLGDSVVTGMAGQTLDALAATAAAYGVPLSRGSAQTMVRKVLAGQASVESFEDVYREQAKRLYGQGIADQLDQGFTLADIADPYLELAARELGVSKSQMDLTEPRWTRALTYRPPGSKEQAPMNMDEWQRTLRTDSTYGWDRTSGARSSAANLAASLGQMMGAL